MKRILITVIAIFAINVAFSQVKFGFKFGGNFASVSDVKAQIDGVTVDIYDYDGVAFGFLFGAFTNISFLKFLAFQPELLFSMQGGKQRFGSGFEMEYSDRPKFSGGLDLEHLDNGTRYVFNYINLPLLLEIKVFNTGAGVLIGPQFGMNVYNSSTLRFKTQSGAEFDNSLKENFGGSPERFDMSLATGLQYTEKHIIIGVRYNFGLTNHLNTIDDTGTEYKGWKNNVLQISLSCFF